MSDQIDLLRSTVQARLEEITEGRQAEDLPPYDRGAAVAYLYVLLLLGPEPAWALNDDGEPF